MSSHDEMGEREPRDSRPLSAPWADQSPTREELIERDIAGETVCGYRVAAYRETHPEHGDKYGHRYSEHWSTPSRDPRVKVERLFTEDQLRDALLRSDSQRIAELEGRLNGLSQGAKVAHPSVRPEDQHSAGWVGPIPLERLIEDLQWLDTSSPPLLDGWGRNRCKWAAEALVERVAALSGRPGHTAEGKETRDEQIAPALQAQDAWDWLASRINLELDWGETEEDEAAWRIHRVSGARNDREWELIATGTTPLAAVQAARKALPALQTQGAEQ